MPGGEEETEQIVFGFKLVECKSEKPKFLGNPNSYLAIRGGGHREDPDWNNRRPRLKQQKTIAETTFHYFAF